ncbi:DUF2948 family protein [Temperatibacter marinus]|uniref:DUF2948 family protein n=1 Tax=Temperatibacter marinus TaxID=1456591 RepID=A0AA52EJ00_9PROT|nr:DUF2948 family protein [Temperatibacter marinus]WND04038.1 DUF2948 family protein [Temperatibacter marinus]
MSEPLKLKVETPEDLTLLASLVQDAAIVGSDMHYDPKAHQFILMANRYCWEKKRPWWQRGLFAIKHPGERQRCALHFNTVMDVKYKSQTALDKDAVFSLLDVKISEEDSEKLELIFAGHMSIALKIECVEIFLTDQGETFEALARPDHTKDYSE